jgi:transcription termination factor Rho
MPVLRRKELEESSLADLHTIASELGLEGFRAKRKSDLIDSILEAAGTDVDAGEDDGPDEVPAEEALEPPTVKAGDEPKEEDKPEEEEEDESEDEEEETSEGSSSDTSEGTSEGTSSDTSEGTSSDTSEGTSSDTSEDPDDAEKPSPPAERREDKVATGTLDILANGSGFVRVDAAGQSRDDVYVSPAQIRRCELRAGDEVSGPARPPRRNERHPSLVHVEQVNGRDAEPPEERPLFGDLTPVFPSDRLTSSAAPAAAPFGRGSRVAVAGPPGAGATTLLRDLAGALSDVDDLEVQVVLAGARPEEVTDWRAHEGLDVVGGSFERSADAQTQAAELAVERAKRRVERGGHAALLIDSLDALPAGAQRRLFGAARATAEGGTLTVIAATGDSPEALRWATTRIVLEAGGKVADAESGTLRSDALG